MGWNLTRLGCVLAVPEVRKKGRGRPGWITLAIIDANREGGFTAYIPSTELGDLYLRSGSMEEAQAMVKATLTLRGIEFEED